MARTSPRLPSPSLEPHPLGAFPRRWKRKWREENVSSSSSQRPWREESVSSSSSPLTADILPSSLDSEVDSMPQSAIRENRVRCRGSTSYKYEDNRSTTKSLGSSSTLLISSAGLKLAHMLTLIRQEDVEFKQYPEHTQIYFPSKMIGEPSVVYRLKARHLRRLIAYAHHLDEEDQLLKVPSLPVVSLPHSTQP